MTDHHQQGEGARHAIQQLLLGQLAGRDRGAGGLEPRSAARVHVAVDDGLGGGVGGIRSVVLPPQLVVDSSTI
jgi:hypothetical protein